jgi:hypothetical protein
MIRWAVLAQSGKSYRVYAFNRTLAVFAMIRQTAEKWAGVVVEAGVWEDGRLETPEWDTASITGWPGGPSGRPPQKGEEKKPSAETPEQDVTPPPVVAVTPVVAAAATCVSIRPPATDACGKPATHAFAWAADDVSMMCESCALAAQQLALSHGRRISATRLEAETVKP